MSASSNAHDLACRRLERLFRTATRAAMPGTCLGDHWPVRPEGRLAVLAIGKGAAAMAAAAAGHYGDGIEGLVLAPDGHLCGSPLPPGLHVMTSSHPVPDQRSVLAADAALRLAAGLAPEDLLLALVSGGGSAVMCKPRQGVSLAQKQELTRQLHASGTSIAEINCVRTQLSGVKGGRLSATCKAPVVTLAISDVPGDDPSLISSGPTMPNHGTPGDALGVLEKYGIDAGTAVRAVLQAGAQTNSGLPERPADACTIVASGKTMLEAAAEALVNEGCRVINLGDDLEGEARELAGMHAEMVRGLAKDGRRCCILSGGEATVTLDSNGGLGGRNTEFMLALAIELDGLRETWAIAGDSDGIDGRGEHAGAMIGPDTLARAATLGLDAKAYLEGHDSASFFSALGDLVTTGATLTNVNDFRAILINQ